MTYIQSNAEKLRDHIKAQWEPPLKGLGPVHTIVQTAIMQTLAWTHGKEFIGDMTPNQETAIDQGLAEYQKFFGE